MACLDVSLNFLSYQHVFACGSSIAGTVSFLEEAEFNEVVMVPSSDQLTVGKVGPALRPGWTRIILCMAGGPGWSTSHMSANESILSYIEDEQRVFIFDESYCLHCYDGGV